MAVLFVELTQGQQGFDAFAAGFANANQDAGGKGDFCLSRQGDGFEAHDRVLVWRAVVGHALFAQAAGSGFEHDAHGGGHRAQKGDFLGRHIAGIDVGQEARFIKYGFGYVGDVFEGAGKTQLGQCRTGGVVAQFGFFTEGKQRLLAALARALAGNIQHLFNTHIRLFDFARGLGEGAVVAHIAAQMGEGNKHLAGIGNSIAMGAIAQRSGDLHQCGQVGTVRQLQGLLLAQGDPVQGLVEQLSHGGSHKEDIPDSRLITPTGHSLRLPCSQVREEDFAASASCGARRAGGCWRNGWQSRPGHRVYQYPGPVLRN